MSPLPETAGPHADGASAPPPCRPLRPHAVFCCRPYLPSEEPADTDDAQDIEHRGAHDGPDSHVALGNEDP